MLGGLLWLANPLLRRGATVRFGKRVRGNILTCDRHFELNFRDQVIDRIELYVEYPSGVVAVSFLLDEEDILKVGDSITLLIAP